MEEEFCLDSFQKWIREKDKFVYSESKKNNMLREKVFLKETVHKITSKISLEDGDLGEVILEFKKKGGIAIDMDRNEVHVQVSCGSFIIPKKYIELG